jgi:hypothetical protein
VTDVIEFDERTVEEKYGVPASRYADFAVLRGDSSDGRSSFVGRCRSCMVPASMAAR